ncbi:MAG: FecCD family ABC transporter permease [Candidatus Odinarchaeota archaeon]
MVKDKKFFFLIFFFFFILFSLLISILLAVSIGSISINIGKINGIILNAVGFDIDKTWTPGEENIILYLRLPRVLMSVGVGMMLGISGVVAQGLFRNPIVDPYIIGISSSAGFGTALSIVLGISGLLSIFTLPLVSFLFSCITVLIIYYLSKTRYHLSMTALLLSGIALSYFFSAFTSFILYFTEEHSHFVMIYLMGSFWGTTWSEFFLIFVILINGFVILFFYMRDLNAMVLGDSTAQSLGVNVELSKRVMLILMTLLTSTTVAFCGSIGFVGLVVPHIMRWIIGSDNKKLLVFSALGGSLLLIWSDLVARTIFSPLELPVGILTSLLGGPFFVYLIIKKKKSGELL